MQIESRDESSAKIVTLTGKLDTVTAPQAEEHILGLVDQGSLNVVLDFTDVDFVSSAGLRILLASTKKLRAKGGELRVCCLNETVQDVFDLSGFSTLLKVYPSLSDATAAL